MGVGARAVRVVSLATRECWVDDRCLGGDDGRSGDWRGRTTGGELGAVGGSLCWLRAGRLGGGGRSLGLRVQVAGSLQLRRLAAEGAEDQRCCVFGWWVGGCR